MIGFTQKTKIRIGDFWDEDQRLWSLPISACNGQTNLILLENRSFLVKGITRWDKTNYPWSTRCPTPVDTSFTTQTHIRTWFKHTHWKTRQLWPFGACEMARKTRGVLLKLLSQPSQVLTVVCSRLTEVSLGTILEQEGSSFSNTAKSFQLDSPSWPGIMNLPLIIKCAIILK